MADSARDHLLSVIQASDAVVSDEGDSEDPVALRRVLVALAQKGSALGKLGRLDQAVGVWDELISRHRGETLPRASLVVMNALSWKARDLERLARYDEAMATVSELVGLSRSVGEGDAVTRLTVRALAVRSRSLAALGRIDEAVSSAREIVVWAGESKDREVREWAAWALERESRLLIADGRIDQGLAASARLVTRLLDEPSESLVQVAGTINNHSLLLLQLGAPNLSAVVRFALLLLINTSSQVLHRATSKLTHHVPARVLRSVRKRRSPSTDRLSVTSEVLNSRRRAEQAQAASDAVIAKLGAPQDPDLRRCVAAAEFISGLAIFVLGHPLAGTRAIERFTNRADLEAIQAFQWVTKRQNQDNSVVGELGNISNAALRAQMLGGNDPAITKIAYDDTIAERQAASAHPTLTRVAARLLRPKVKKTPTTNVSRDETPG